MAEKNLVEEALLQMDNLQEAITNNAKGILASTMKEEISQLVKESLEEEEVEESSETEMSEQEEELELDMEVGDEDEGEELDIDSLSDNEDDEELEMGDEEMLMTDLPGDDLEVDDEEEVLSPLDLTMASDDEILKVFKAMGEEDGIIVKQDDDEIHLSDNESDAEYVIQLGESEEESNEVEGKHLGETEDLEEGDYMEEDDIVYEIELDEEEEMSEGDYMEEEKEMTEGDYMEEEEMTEGKYGGNKGDIKSADRRKKGHYGKGPKKKETAGEEGELDYEETKEGKYGGNKGDIKSADRRKKGHYGKGPKKKETAGEEGELDYEETKEGMVRSHAAGQYASSDSKKGLPKPHSVPNKSRLKNESLEKEVEQLREKNEEYRKALNIFKEKLNEVAVFNSNLAYATRLFTEHSTTKQEKINILRRFDGVETIKESKSLYKTIKEDLGGKESNVMTESVQSKVQKTPTKGSANNLIESKTYENPQFLRMKDLMNKIIK